MPDACLEKQLIKDVFDSHEVVRCRPGQDLMVVSQTRMKWCRIEEYHYLMASMKNSQNTMLAHSRAKVEFYEKYLERYLPILSLSKYISAINIYDVFCGRGVYENGGEGSPVRALKAIVEAKKKYPSGTRITLRLNDNDKNNIDSVKQYIAHEVPGYEQFCDVKFASVDAESLLDSMTHWISSTRNDERNLLFIDPYGYKTIHKDTIDGLMKNGRTEIILFLPVSFMHRFKDYAMEADAETIAPLRRFTEDFFPEGHPVRNVDEEMNVHEYIDFLKEAFSFDGKYYTSSYQIELGKGKFFALFFMTSNLLGFEKILEVKWSLDEEDGNGFVLEKDSLQPSLFDDFFADQKKQEHSNKLSKYLIDYLNIPRNNGELYEFVLKKGYLSKHATGILNQWQDEGQLEVVDLVTGKPARKGSFYLKYEAVKNPSVKIELK